MNPSNSTPIVATLNHPYSEFEISFTQEQEKKLFCIKIAKKLSQTSYLKVFSLKDLGKENASWLTMENEGQFENLILTNMTENLIEAQFKENSAILIFCILYGKDQKIKFPMVLDRKEAETKEVCDILASHLLKLDLKVEQFTKEIRTNLEELKSEIEKETKKIIGDNLDKFEKESKDRLNREILKYEEMKNEIFKDVSLLTLLKSSFENYKKDEVEFLYSPFLAPQNADANTVLSNNNYTLNRTASNWFGVRCNPLNKEGKFLFSVRIDSYANAIMFGYCISNVVNISAGTGYYGSSNSYMFYITSNNFYNKGASTQYAFIAPVPIVGDIFSVFLDTKKKCMVLYLNGKQYSIPKSMNINENEKIYLAPCVDMVGSGTTVSLVDFKDISI